MLLTTGYLPDARTFYCPSATNMGSGNYGSLGDTNTQGGYSLNHWKQAGGFDRNAMLFGDWDACRNTSSTSFISSAYHYRNVPLQLRYYQWYRGWERVRHPWLKVPGVRGDAYAQLGNPFFKTHRQLGNRAVVCDTFSKGISYDGLGREKVRLGRSVADSNKAAGFGIQAHRVAYNTLYGDGHPAVLGDPQERILWHAESYNDSETDAYNSACSSLVANSWQGREDDRHPFGRSIDHETVKNTSLAVWHEFDVAGGIDVDAP